MASADLDLLMSELHGARASAQKLSTYHAFHSVRI